MLRNRRLPAAAWLLLTLVLIALAPRSALAQSVLSEPDFTGMYRPDGNARVIARDAARGWTYLSLATDNLNNFAFLNGVRGTPLVRVNDAGVVDANWFVDSTLKPSYALVLGSGDLLVYDTAWRRLIRGSDGVLRAQTLAQPFEPGALPLAQPTARDAAGNVYILYSRTAGSAVDALRRIQPNGEPDTAWRLQIDLAFGSVTHFTIAADGSVFYISSNIQPPFSIGAPGASTLVRIAGTDGLRWTRAFTGKTLALSTDGEGRAYVLGNALSLGGHSGSLLRVDAAGTVDSGWGVAATPAPAPSAGALCVRDGAVLVAALQYAEPVANLALTRVPLAAGGAATTSALAVSPSAQPICAGEQIAVRTARSVALASNRNGAIDTQQVAAVAGTRPVIARIQRWGNYFVVGGQFEYWFEGVRYVNLMRLRADNRPDASWRPDITGPVLALRADPAGGLLVGGDKLTGAQSHLLRYDANGQRDARFNHTLDGAVQAIAIAANGDVYAGGKFSSIDGTARPALARFAPDGGLDTSWVPTLPNYSPPGIAGTAYNVRDIVLANDDDALVTWDFFKFTAGGEGMSRVGRRNQGEGHPLTETLERLQIASLIRDDFTGTLFGLRQRITAPFGTELIQIDNGTLSPLESWPPYATVSRAVAFDGQRVFLQDGSSLWRTGAASARWTPDSVPYSGREPLFAASDALVWPVTGAPFAVRVPPATIGPRSVVEYFAKDANRFFITARADEQAMLDALPASFARTGMQFQAFDGSVVPPPAGVNENNQPAQVLTPIGAFSACRYFSPRERGGSGTHFYGLRGDCQLLNTFAGFVNEGYDFALHAAKLGTCTAATPIAVYRLFNNRAAQNDGNHRYVVSPARRDEMLARGWLDEGVVFCVSAATDSRAFGNW